MTTILQIAQRASYRTGVQAPSGLVAATDNNSLQLLHLMVELSEELRNLRSFPQQKKTYTFDMESARSHYPLPIDFYCPLLRTHWNYDNKRRLVGPLTDGDFTEYQYGAIGNPYEYAFRIFGSDGNNYTAGGQFEVYPTPTASDITLKFEYLSRNLFLPKYWQISTAYTSGQYVSSNGKIYLCDTNGTSSATTAVDGVTQNITDNTTRWDYQNILYEFPLADTDISIFDDDIMILGLRAKLLEAREMPGAAAAMANYQKLLNRAKSRWEGSFVGSFCRKGFDPRPRPATQGGWTI